MSSRIVSSIKVATVVLGVLFFTYIGSVLPRMNAGIFASPDETAVYLFAKAWTPSGGFKIAVKGNDAIRSEISLHPRSMIRQGDWLVPVGFLGMPFLIALIGFISSSWAPYLTLCLALSAAFPLFWMLKSRWGSFVGWSSSILFLSFPTVLLYVNRGLFPNLPVVALAIWGVWLGMKASDCFLRAAMRDVALFSGAAGLAFGLALLIRPIEAVWMIPWMLWSMSWIWRAKKKSRDVLRAAIPFFAMMIIIGTIGVCLSMRTYPYNGSLSKQPVSGYQLKDYAPSEDMRSAAAPASSEIDRDIRTLIPISFHPRVMLENVRTFFFDAQGIWFAASFIGAICAWLKRKRHALPVLILSGWTFLSFCLLYGQVLYADNINGVPTLGNSFLRYAIPLVPLLAVGCAIAADELRKISARGFVLGISLVAFLSCYGIAYAANGDSESILATRKQIARYVQIREQTREAIPNDALIISERSDKVFASGSWTVVSPIPDSNTLIRVRNSEAPLYFFHRLADTDSDFPKPISDNFFVADPVVILDNEALYPLYGMPEYQ